VRQGSVCVTAAVQADSMSAVLLLLLLPRLLLLAWLWLPALPAAVAKALSV
jgi:hypothetical protein